MATGDEGSSSSENEIVIRLQDELRMALDREEENLKELSQTQQLLHNFVEKNPILSFIKDELGRYMYVSKSFCDFFRVSKDSVLGKTDLEWLPSSLAEQFIENDNHVRTTGKALETIESVPIDGEMIHSIVHKFPVRVSGGRTFIGGTAIDITSKIEAEDKIKLLNAELATKCTELSSMNVDLQAARDEALKSSRIKSMFLANMSHELRTPLSAILGINEMLLLTELSEEQRTLADMVQTSGKNLLQLVNDLLDLSKIEAGKLALTSKEFDIRNIVENVVRSVSIEGRRKSLEILTELSPGMPHTLIGDPLRLNQVLLNLMGNAVKFTESGFVKLEMDVEALEDEMVLLQCRIVDSGVGIAWDDLKLLFQPFSQLDQLALQNGGGTGLGLAISKALVELMGGRIHVNSEKGRGTTFSFVVRLQRKKPEPVSENPTWIQDDFAEKLLKGKKILVVEDNALMREVAQRQLARFSVDTFTAEDGEEAIELFSSHQFDLILMDCQLPGISGFEVTERIRQREDGSDRHVPIIAVTASVMKGDAGKCIASGMDDFLSKPVSLQALKEKLVFWLSKVCLGS